MSLILTTIAKDPSALAECCAAVFTACYVAKLTFSDQNNQNDMPLRSLRSARGNAVLCRTLGVDANNNPAVSAVALREKLLRFFAVGELVSIPKKSLRRQSTFWHK